MRALGNVVAVGLVLSRIARAEPPAEPKSVGTALALSLATTLGGTAAMIGGAALADRAERDGDGGVEALGAGIAIGGLAGVLVGPSLGHVYAGRTWNTGLVVRLAGLGFGAGVIATAVVAVPEDEDAAAIVVAAIGLAGGIALYATGAAIEIATAARRAARESPVDARAGRDGSGTRGGARDRRPLLSATGSRRAPRSTHSGVPVTEVSTRSHSGAGHRAQGSAAPTPKPRSAASMTTATTQ